MTGKLGDDFVEAVGVAIEAQDFSSVADADIQRVMSAALKFYAAKAEVTGELPAPVGKDTTPTEVVVMVSELIRAVDLNLFDLSMWYRRAR